MKHLARSMLHRRPYVKLAFVMHSRDDTTHIGPIIVAFSKGRALMDLYLMQNYTKLIRTTTSQKECRSESCL